MSLEEFIRQHGARVRRAEAMWLLGITRADVFRKLVDARPDLRHRLPGERQDKYVSAVIYELLPKPGVRPARN
jgi:hypothetical protein